MEKDSSYEENLRNAQRLSQTPSGQKLIQELSRQKSAEINSAIQKGDMEQMKSLIREFLNSPEAQKIRSSIED